MLGRSNPASRKMSSTPSETTALSRICLSAECRSPLATGGTGADRSVLHQDAADGAEERDLFSQRGGFVERRAQRERLRHRRHHVEESLLAVLERKDVVRRRHEQFERPFPYPL